MVNDIVNKMKYSRPVILAGRLSLRELTGILSEPVVLICICNDSGPMHIAAAMKTPTVAIFGRSKSHETGPYADKSGKGLPLPIYLRRKYL